MTATGLEARHEESKDSTGKAGMRAGEAWREGVAERQRRTRGWCSLRAQWC